VVLPIHATSGPIADAVRLRLEHNQNVILALQNGPAEAAPSAENISRFVGHARVVHTINLPNGDMRIRLHVQSRAKSRSFSRSAVYKCVPKSLTESSSLALNAGQEKLIEEAKERFTALGQFDPGSKRVVAVCKELFDPARWLISSPQRCRLSPQTRNTC